MRAHGPVCVQDVVAKLRAPGRYNSEVAFKGKEEALAVARKALPHALQLQGGVAGQRYPKAPGGVFDRFEVYPPEPSVGHGWRVG